MLRSHLPIHSLLLLFRKNPDLFQVKIHLTKSLYLSLHADKGDQWDGSKNYGGVGGEDSLENALKGEQAVGKKFDFAIPPSLLLLDGSFRGHLEM